MKKSSLNSSYMESIKKPFKLLGGIVVITMLIPSCSNTSKSLYYIEQESDTIAFLASKNDSSKIAEIVNWHFDYKNDSIYEKIYSYYNLYGYRTCIKSHEYNNLDGLTVHIPISVSPEHEFTRLILNGNIDTLAYIMQRDENKALIYTPTKYLKVDSLFLKELIYTFQLNNCKIYDTDNLGDNELDYYAILDEKRLTIYDKPFKKDTLRLLDYGSDFIRNTYNSAKTMTFSKEILHSAISIRDLGDFLKKCMIIPNYKEKALEVIDSLKYYQPYIFRRLRHSYEDILKEELKEYELDNIMLYDDYDIHPTYELYLSSNYFINDKICHRVFAERDNVLRLLGIQQVTYNWSSYANYDNIIKVKPKPLSDEYIGREKK